MGRIQRSIELFKQSWGILKQDRELVWLPVMSAVLSIIVAAVIMVPIALSEDWSPRGVGETSESVSPTMMIAMFTLAVVLGFISVFFRGALVSGAHERMTGGDPTVRSSIAGALERLGKLFSWALITTIVGTILRSIEERSGMLGRFVISLVGMAWAVTTFLVIPVIIIENTGAIDATKRSVQLFKGTWGENLSGQVGFGLIGLLAFLPIIALAVLGAFIGTLLGFVLIALAIVAGAIAMAVMSALGAIFQTALYHYAADSELIDGFEPAVMSDAFKPRTSGRF